MNGATIYPDGQGRSPNASRSLSGVSPNSYSPSLHTERALTPTDINDPSMKPRGLAALSSERRREISVLGGKAAHAQGKAHRFTSEQAKQAGKRGAGIPRRKRKETR
jgi:hypothetical protein